MGMDIMFIKSNDKYLEGHSTAYRASNILLLAQIYENIVNKDFPLILLNYNDYFDCSKDTFDFNDTKFEELNKIYYSKNLDFHILLDEVIYDIQNITKNDIIEYINRNDEYNEIMERFHYLSEGETIDEILSDVKRTSIEILNLCKINKYMFYEIS